MHLSHQIGPLREHQPKVRIDHEDVSRPKSTRYLHTQQWMLFFSRIWQVESGFLRDKSIRNQMVHKIGIFNSVSVSVSLND